MARKRLCVKCGMPLSKYKRLVEKSKLKNIIPPSCVEYVIPLDIEIEAQANVPMIKDAIMMVISGVNLIVFLTMLDTKDFTSTNHIQYTEPPDEAPQRSKDVNQGLRQSQV